MVFWLSILKQSCWEVAKRQLAPAGCPCEADVSPITVIQTLSLLWSHRGRKSSEPDLRKIKLEAREEDGQIKQRETSAKKISS